MDPYETLGLDLSTRDPSDVSMDEIKAAYQALARKHHPDRRGGGDKAEGVDSNSVFIAVQEAWEMIGTTEERRKYDKSVLGSHKNVTRSEEVSLTEFIKSRALVVDESDGTEREMWVYEKACRCGDTYEFTEIELASGFNTSQCHGCSLYATIV